MIDCKLMDALQEIIHEYNSIQSRDGFGVEFDDFCRDCAAKYACRVALVGASATLELVNGILRKAGVID